MKKSNKHNDDGFIPFEDLIQTDKRKFNKKNIKYILLAIAAVICVIVECIPGFPGWYDVAKRVTVSQSVIEEEGKFYAHFIDVGQADCELLKCGDDIVLIDAGDVDSYEDISSYLDSQNVEELDYFIITHMHADHMGSASRIVERYKPENIIMTRLSEENTPTTELYERFLETLSKCDAKIIPAKPGASYELSSFGFSVLAPNSDYKELNNTSVVVKAYFGDNTYLFQGDAEAKSEKDILSNGFNVKADVLKLGHHGSKTSSNDKYLDAVNPKVAVACCGAENKYNHPNEETLIKLEKRGIPLYRTDISGNIVIVSDGREISIITER